MQEGQCHTQPGENVHCDTNLVAEKLANLTRTRVRDGQDLDQLSLFDGLGFGSSEARIERNAPMRAEPYERLQGDDCTAPDKCPLRCTDVFLVKIGREIVA